MHIVTDENGNICPHAHSHADDHEHGGCCQGQEHDCRSHEQNGDCHHCHDGGTGTPAEKNAALLKYMLDHNTHHAMELEQMAEKLSGEGQTGAAEQIRKAVDEFQKGNLYLSLALSSIKEN